jgi:hypothetical protein
VALTVVAAAIAAACSLSLDGYTDGAASPDGGDESVTVAEAGVGGDEAGGGVDSAAPDGGGVLCGLDSIAGLVDDSVSGDDGEVFRCVAKASGTATRMFVWVTSQTTLKNASIGIYSDTAGAAASLLASGPLTSPKPNAWNEVTLAPTNIVAGSVYWLAVASVGGTKADVLAFKSTDHGGPAFGNGVPIDTALPAMWTSDNTNYHGAPIAAYITP